MAVVPEALRSLVLEEADDLQMQPSFVAGLHRRATAAQGVPVLCSVVAAWPPCDRDVSDAGVCRSWG